MSSTHFVRRALLMLLTLSAAVRFAEAQSLACSTILPGETVSRVAMRMTGFMAHRHQSWFHVVVPETGRIVAKSRYDDVQAGWRACVVQARPAGRYSVPKTSAVAHLEALPDRVVRLTNGVNLDPFVWCVFGVAAVLFWITANRYFSQRERTIGAMTAYVEQFLCEFNRPLIDPVLNAAPVRSRVRVSPDGGRLEIRLAPAGGRRYPNLSDHKENVAYDVGRIVRSLRNPSFVCGPVYAQGAWVVVPFHFHGSPNKEGTS